MSWWGYWNGQWHGDYTSGVEFLERGLARTYGQNFVTIQVDDALASLSAIVPAMERAADDGLGILLHVHDILYNGCVVDTEGPRARNGYPYQQADYDEWREKLTRLSAGLTPKARSSIIALSGFDDMNPGRAFGCFEAAPGLPSPVQESMRQLAVAFPDVALRGHVWQIQTWSRRGGDPAAKREWLQGATFVIAYSYPRAASTVDGASRRCRWPARTGSARTGLFRPLPTDAERMRDDLQAFIEFLNEDSSTLGLPVLFVPPSHLSWGLVTADEERGIGCALEAAYERMRCLAVSTEGTWASQVLGFMPFNWSTNRSGNSPFWRGVEDSPTLRRVGRTIGAMRSCESPGLDERVAQPLRGRWQYQRCGLEPDVEGRFRCDDLPAGTDPFEGDAADPSAPPRGAGTATARTWTAVSSGTLALLSVVTLDRSVADDASVAILKNGARVWPPSPSWRPLSRTNRRAVIRHRVAVQPGDRVQLVTRGADEAAADPTRVQVRLRLEW